MKNFILGLLILTIAIFIAGCGDSGSDKTSEPTVKGSDKTSEPTVTSIEVNASTLMIASGYEVTFNASAYLTDSTSKVVTNESKYISSDTTVLVKDNNISNMFHALNIGTAVVTTQYLGHEYNTTITVTDALLLSIDINASALEVPKGKTLPCIATGHYSDNTSSNISSSVDWLSTTSTINSYGLLFAENIGSTNVSASINGIESNVIEVTVSDAILEDLNLTVDKTEIYPSDTANYTLKGIMSDGTHINIDNIDSSWVSLDESIATISNTGVLNALSAGTVTITVTYNNISTTNKVTIDQAYLESITITGSSTVKEALTTTLVATGTYYDTTTKDITSSVVWTSSDTNVATVNYMGIVQAIHEGSTTITAVKNNISTTFEISVEKLIVSTINIYGSSSLENKSEAQLDAFGIDANGTSINITNYSTWTSSDTNIATVSANGFITAISDGSVDIEVNLNGATSTKSISITPYLWINKMSSSIFSNFSSCINNYCSVTYGMYVTNNSVINTKLIGMKIYSRNTSTLVKNYSADIIINAGQSANVSSGKLDYGSSYYTIVYEMLNLDNNDVDTFSITTRY